MLLLPGHEQCSLSMLIYFFFFLAIYISDKSPHKCLSEMNYVLLVMPIDRYASIKGCH